jgi:hypothetical protein
MVSMDVFSVVSVIAAILFVLSGWLIITGKHNRYFRQFRRHGIPPPERRRHQR